MPGQPRAKGRPTGGTRTTLSLSLSEGIEAMAVRAAPDQTFEISGCPASGLLGFDLNFHVLPVDHLRRSDNLARRSMVPG
jgi:hypothetical protein